MKIWNDAESSLIFQGKKLKPIRYSFIRKLSNFNFFFYNTKSWFEATYEVLLLVVLTDTNTLGDHMATPSKFEDAHSL